MFETLKEILLSEIREEVEAAKKIIDEIQALKKEDARLKEPERNILLSEPRNTLEDYNFLTKIIMRKKYKEDQKSYNEKLASYKSELAAEEKASDEYSKRKNSIQERLKELREQKDPEKLKEIIERYERIRNAKKLSELGLNFKQAEDIFNEKGLPMVLDEKDTIMENGAKIDKLDDLVLIHKTNYAPSDGIIKTAKEAGATMSSTLNLDGETYEISIPRARETIHFCVNGEVSSHAYGSWEKSKYAAIVPLANVPNIVVFNPVDTYSKGNVEINNGNFLCPLEEVDKIKANNPGLSVIGYKGKEDVSGFANAFITALGYKYERGNEYDWDNQQDSILANEIVSKNTFIRQSGDHAYMPERAAEDAQEQIVNNFKTIVEKIFEINKDFEPKSLANQLLGMGSLSKTPQIQMVWQNIFTDENTPYFEALLTNLKQYGIETPNYIRDLYMGEKTIPGFTLDKVKGIESIPQDTMQYIEQLRINYDGKVDISGIGYTGAALVYEVLKQVKELNKENIMAKQGDVKVY